MATARAAQHTLVLFGSYVQVSCVLNLQVRSHQARANQGPFTVKRKFEISMVQALPSRVKRYISGTSKARCTIYRHVMHISTLSAPGARLEREKMPDRRLRETPPGQVSEHPGQPLQHHRCRLASNRGRCGPLVREPSEMALR